MIRLSRREWLRGIGALFGASLVGRAGTPGKAASNEPTQAASFRFVHLTDIHVQPELRADQGMAACLKHVATLDPAPDFILRGGDLVMDVLEVSADRATMLFNLFTRVLRDHTSLPVYHCLGNHDVFGWGKKHGVTPEHAQYGKKMYCDAFGYDKTYYTFDHKGWRFFVLDSVLPSDKQLYEGGIDPEQWDWLQEQLQQKPAEMPAVVVTHIPFLSVTVLPDNRPDGQFRIGPATMCKDAQKAALLFGQHNVRLAISGHIHMVDEVLYRGVKYVCDGAVSGRWWKGANKEFPEGYGVFDLMPDGTSTYRYVTYGWQAEET